MDIQDRKILWYYNQYFNLKRKHYYEGYQRSFLGKPATYTRMSAKGWDFLNSSYYEAVHKYKLTDNITREDFNDWVCYEKMHNPWSRDFRHERLGRRVYNWRHRHNMNSGYVKREHHKKKVLSDEQINKKEWREYKGFAKDQADIQKRRGAGRYFKRKANKKNRAWSRDLMSHDLHEEMCNNDYKIFIDRWAWD